jgi:Uri superfamily endonuclease
MPTNLAKEAVLLKGSYVLLIDLPEGQEIAAGKLRTIDFPAGCYAYVGSAMGGMKSRLERHLRRDKKLHWHIDYLLQKASVSNVIICESETRTECTIAQTIRSKFETIKGFGSSDCKCPGHLFYSPCAMEQDVFELLKTQDMKPKLIANTS